MEITKLKPRRALNKAFLKVKPKRTEIQGFKTNVIQLLDRTNDTESEEFHKNLTVRFLNKVWYGDKYFVNVSERNDLVIRTGPKSNDPIGVLIETKERGKNNTPAPDMVTKDNFNKKSSSLKIVII